MGIKDISPQEIKQKRLERMDEIQLLQEKIGGLERQHYFLSGLIVDVKKRIEGIQTRIKLLDAALVLRGGLSSAVVKLRKKIIKARLESKREDITVSRQKQLEAEVVKLTANLKAVCPHTFLVQDENYYAGKICEDYDEGRGDHRICFVCGTNEYSDADKMGKFAILYTAPTRLMLWRYSKNLEKILIQKDFDKNFVWELTMEAIIDSFTVPKIRQLFSIK